MNNRDVRPPFFPSLPPNAAPPTLFKRHPAIYGPWAGFSEALMNGPSSLERGERELLLAYAAGIAGCDFVSVAHGEVAYALGIEHGTVERLLEDPTANAGGKLAPMLAFVAKLMRSPVLVDHTDADAVFAAGWDEASLSTAIAIAGRASFMQRLVQGHGFTPPTREVAAYHAARRVQLGYRNLYPQFRGDTETTREDNAVHPQSGDQ